jgi:hypothetical protein
MLFWSDYVHFGCGNAAAHHFAGLKPCAYVEGGGCLGKRVERYTGINQRAQEHVAAYAGKAFKICSTHR